MEYVIDSLWFWVLSWIGLGVGVGGVDSANHKLKSAWDMLILNIPEYSASVEYESRC